MMPLFVVIYLCLFLRVGGDMKVQSFCTALRALSHKDVQYGSHATSEQVYLSSVLYFLEKKKEKKKVHVITNLSRIFCLPFDFPNMVYSNAGDCSWRLVCNLPGEDACSYIAPL